MTKQPYPEEFKIEAVKVAYRCRADCAVGGGLRLRLCENASSAFDLLVRSKMGRSERPTAHDPRNWEGSTNPHESQLSTFSHSLGW